jgi:hypothetical protein
MEHHALPSKPIPWCLLFFDPHFGQPLKLFIDRQYFYCMKGLYHRQTKPSFWAGCYRRFARTHTHDYEPTQKVTKTILNASL